MKHLVAITGGIGSGKSVVSRVLRILGYPVYDCDSRAKALMDADETIKRRIADEIDRLSVSGGTIDRRRLASVVFGNKAMLTLLNSIVHSAVKADLAAWVQSCTGDLVFVETAILYESGLNLMADAEWRVESPHELRVERTTRRSSINRSEVEARMAAQHIEAPKGVEPLPLAIIRNDEVHALLPQIEALLP